MTSRSLRKPQVGRSNACGLIGFYFSHSVHCRTLRLAFWDKQAWKEDHEAGHRGLRSLMGTALRGRQLLSAEGELEAEAHELCRVRCRVWAFFTQRLRGGSHWKWEDA